MRDVSTGNGGNVAVGNQAMRFSTTAEYNTYMGYFAGYSAGTSSYCVGVGAYAGNGATASGTANTAVGGYALTALTSGGYNTGLGYQAGTAINSGTHNTCVGYQAGNNLTTSTNCIVIGASVAARYATTKNYQTNIGKQFESFNFAIANSAIETLTDFLAGRRGWIELHDSTNSWSRWRFNSTTVTREDGTADHVTGTTPAASEIAVAASGDDLLIEAGSSAARTIGVIVRAIVM
jgi:hypothetical protein